MLQSHELSEYYYARQVLEQVEIEYRTLKKSHSILQERNNELTMQQDAFKGEINRQKAHAQSTIENCAPNQQYINNVASGVTPPNELYRGYQKGNIRSPFDQKLSDAKAQE